MRAGTGVRRITPPVGVPMGGFGFRERGCEGIRDDLFVRCLWLEGSADRRMVILALDVHALDFETVAAWKGAIRERWGVPPEAVLINVSHTHSGPLMVERFYGSDPPDAACLGLIGRRVLEAVEEASQREEGCSLSFGRRELHLGISRRRPEAEGVRMAPFPAGHVERDLPVLQVCDSRGAPLCVVFSVAAHPSILADYLISSEYPGAACRLVEQALGGRAMALFLQGAGGEIKVNVNADVERGKWVKGTSTAVQRAGRMVADAVLAVLAEGMAPVRPVLAAASGAAALPLALPDDPAAFYEQWTRPEPLPGRAAARAWAEYHAARVARGIAIPRAVPCPVQVLRVAEGVAVVGVAGELTSGLARVIRGALPDADPVLLGYSNGSLGYLPSEAMLPEGGYEAFDSVFYFRDLPAPLAPGLEARLISAINDLIGPCR